MLPIIEIHPAAAAIALTWISILAACEFAHRIRRAHTVEQSHFAHHRLLWDLRQRLTLWPIVGAFAPLLEFTVQLDTILASACGSALLSKQDSLLLFRGFGALLCLEVRISCRLTQAIIVLQIFQRWYHRHILHFDR